MKKYEMIINDIKSGIEKGKYVVGNKLPSEFEIMKQYGVSRITVQNALRFLKDAGIVDRTPKLGTFISSKFFEQKSSNTIYLILFNSVKELLKIIEGAEKRIQELNSNTLIKIKLTNGDPQLEKQYCQEAISNNAKGIIIFSINEIHNKEFFFKTVTSSVPMVFIDRHPDFLPCNFVVSNNFVGMQLITNYIISLGHTKIAYISNGKLSSLDERKEGYLYSLHQNNIEVNPNYIQENELQLTSIASDDLSVSNTVERLLNLNEPPTAIMCCNDICAVFTIKKLRQLGYRVPEDFSVCGYDNAEYSRSNYYSVTTVDIDFRRIGYVATDIILSKPSGADVTQVKIMPKLITRNSSEKVDKPSFIEF